MGANDTTVDPATLKVPEGVELSIIPHEQLKKLTKETSVFCCDAGSQAQGKCKKTDTLMIEGAKSFEISSATLQSGFGGIMHRLEASGLYYVALSNCGNSSPEIAVKFSSGELVTVQRHGYLPSEEVNKLAFYLYLSIAYAVLLGIWCVICSSWSQVLFKIHHYIGICICAGLTEAICWYASLYHWNYLGHRWWSMMLLASLGTVIKQGVSYGLLLLACLGLGVTKARLDSKQIVQVFLVVMAFIVSDGVRQMALLQQDRGNGVVSTWKILLLVTPGSLFVSILYVWILQALQDTLAELTEKGQVVKLEIYTKLRTFLISAIVIVVGLVGYETIVVRRTELAQNWESRWIFTDALSHTCFLFLLAVIMYLWRPNERSIHMAYSEQLTGEAKDTDVGAETVDVELS